MPLAPIALFVYNRPWHTKKTVDALLKNTESEKSDLIVFSDAAKDDKAQRGVNEVRALIRNITGFQSIRIVEQEKNKGLAESIISGVTEIVNQYGSIIVLEDDLETSPHFLNYMNNALERYQTDDKVMQVSGHMFPVESNTQADMLFLPFTTTWGWATWKDSWKYFDTDASGYQVLKEDEKLKRIFDLNNSFPYFHMLERQMDHKIDSWGIRWYLSVFMQQGLVLFPTNTLVLNQGMDGSGVHCGDNDFLEGEKIIKDFSPQSWPIDAQVDLNFFDKVQSLLSSRTGGASLWEKWLSVLNRTFGIILRSNRD